MTGRDMISICAYQTLAEAQLEMQTRGHNTMEVDLTAGELSYLLSVCEYTEKGREDFRTTYCAGFEYGYQTAVKDMIKKLKEIRWYGGGHKAERADGVPGVRTGSVETVQHELRHARADEGHGTELSGAEGKMQDPERDDPGAGE